ncbi:MAG TPA: hypothetical protein GX012_00935, partial [Acholeplasma sp.]|nr:hypothetical protein [Acholeplasma sp.]
SNLKELPANNNYVVCGIVSRKNEFINKNNENMMFVDFTDGIETISFIVFSNNFEEVSKMDENIVLCLTLKKTIYNNKESYQYINLIKEEEV